MADTGEHSAHTRRKHEKTIHFIQKNVSLMLAVGFAFWLVIVAVVAPLRTGRKSTPRGFEPLRAEPNGFLVHHLSHSVTVSMKSCMGLEDPRVTHTSSTSSPGRVAATPTLGIDRRAAQASVFHRYASPDVFPRCANPGGAGIERNSGQVR